MSKPTPVRRTVLDDPITSESTAKIQKWFAERERGQKALELLREFDTWGAVEHDDITDHETMLTALKFIGDFIPKARALLKDGEG